MLYIREVRHCWYTVSCDILKDFVFHFVLCKVFNICIYIFTDVQCEFKLSCVSEIKDDDFIRTTLNKYGIVGPDNSIGSFSNCIREDYRIIEDCIKASTEKGRENLFDYIWKVTIIAIIFSTSILKKYLSNTSFLWFNILSKYHVE